jgi:hypothetical protein
MKDKKKQEKKADTIHCKGQMSTHTGANESKGTNESNILSALRFRYSTRVLELSVP